MSAADRPEALIVMSRDVFEQQFDSAGRTRLEGLVALGEPAWTCDLDDPRVRSRLAEVEVLVTSWGCPRLDAARLDAAPRLRAVFHCAGSVRRLVSDALWRRGITVTTAADANSIPVAEFTFASIILAGKKAHVLAAEAARYRDDWSYAAAHGELSNVGRTVGIVGFSRIGRRVVDLLRVLDEVVVLVSDPYADPLEVAAAGATLVPLADLLPRAEILSLHAPALPATHHMIGAAQLARLPDHATLINTARGALVDTAALEVECASGRLDAILDVTDPEPLPAQSGLYGLVNVTLTPHIAGSTGRETRRMAASAMDEIGRYVAGIEPIARVTGREMGLIA